MRKTIAFLLCFLLLFAFASCTGEKTEEGTTTVTENDTVVTSEPETGNSTGTQTQDAADGWTKIY